MEKEVRRFKINYPLDWTYGVEIKKLKEDLDAIEKLGATFIEIEHGINYDCSWVSIEPIAVQIETDEECKARINEADIRQEETKRRDLQELERLKLKYNKQD